MTRSRVWNSGWQEVNARRGLRSPDISPYCDKEVGIESILQNKRSNMESTHTRSSAPYLSSRSSHIVTPSGVWVRLLFHLAFNLKTHLNGPVSIQTLNIG